MSRPRAQHAVPLHSRPIGYAARRLLRRPRLSHDHSAFTPALLNGRQTLLRLSRLKDGGNICLRKIVALVQQRLVGCLSKCV